jgi:hypothetical protein
VVIDTVENAPTRWLSIPARLWHPRRQPHQRQRRRSRARPTRPRRPWERRKPPVQLPTTITLLDGATEIGTGTIDRSPGTERHGHVGPVRVLT